jgi:hypothetical protein
MSATIDLPFSIPDELVPDFLGKLYYVSEDLEHFRLSEGRRDQVLFRTRAGREERSPIIADRIREVASKMCAGHRRFEAHVLVSHRFTRFPFQKDPRPLLEDRGELFEYGPGRFGLGPLLVSLLEFFDAELLHLADRFSAERRQFPTLIGADVLDRCRYIRSFPHALTLTSHLREDLEAIQNFTRSARVEDGRLTCDPEHLDGVKCLLSPTICFHYYAWLAGKDLAGPQAVTASGRCYRYESGGLSSLERLWDFTMREIVFVGSQSHVLEQRRRCIEAAADLLDSWGLSYEIRSATDPFFVEGYSTQAAFQAAFELKFEVRADLPSAPGKTLAVGSFNYHQDFFGRSLHIQQHSAENAFTACVGFGMERLVWAFLSQYGLDPRDWPRKVREGVSHAGRGR